MKTKTQSKVTFKLFKSTSPNARHPYTGSVLLEGKWYAIEAWVVEGNKAKGEVGKHFEGVVGNGQALARTMVESAKEKAPDDLLAKLDDPDDSAQLRKTELG